jgi:dihydrofolate reductase/thymidylate synthase
MKQFDIILATDINGGIGKNNQLPWQIKEDMEYFKNKTSSVDLVGQMNVVIMGRNTFESIGKKLSNRINIVISSSNIEIDNVKVCKSFYDALNYTLTLDNINNIFVIGGGLLYAEAIHHPLVRYVYLTKINHDYNCTICFNLNQLHNKNKFKLLNYSTYTSPDIKISKILNIEMFKYENIDLGEIQYLNLLENTIKYGQKRNTRNSITYSNFGGQLSFNLQNGFPLLTTKKTFMRGVFEEAKHIMLLGNTNTNILTEKGINIWAPNTSSEFITKLQLPYEQGDMGPMYGFQFRHFNAIYDGMHANYRHKGMRCDKSLHSEDGIDQLAHCMKLLKEDPFNRRIMMTSFNPLQADQGVLYPCHGIVVQFYIKEHNNKKFLCCHMYQRSCDLICGLPFNIASYSIILHILSNILGEEYDVGELIISFGDVHIYDQTDHLDAVQLHLERIPFQFPTVHIHKKLHHLDDIKDLEFTDIDIKNYISHPVIKVNMVA